MARFDNGSRPTDSGHVGESRKRHLQRRCRPRQGDSGPGARQRSRRDGALAPPAASPDPSTDHEPGSSAATARRKLTHRLMDRRALEERAHHATDGPGARIERLDRRYCSRSSERGRLRSVCTHGSTPRGNRLCVTCLFPLGRALHPTAREPRRSTPVRRSGPSRRSTERKIRAARPSATKTRRSAFRRSSPER
jgi:hypothetical protein